MLADLARDRACTSTLASEIDIMRILEAVEWLAYVSL